MTLSKWMTSLLGLAMLAGTAPVRAELTADALLKVLVRKGVFTQEEANAVRAEAEKESTAPKPAGEIAALQASVAKIQKTSISGFLQVRATTQKYASPSTRFLDRRTRVVLKNTSEIGRLAISLDSGPTAVGSGFALMDGFYDWFLTRDKGKVAGLTLRSGQFVKPFGLEFERPTADYEFPELPAGWTALFPGYRDVGFSLSKGLDPNTKWDLGIVNGNGAGYKDSPNRDNDNHKDILARIRHTVPNVGEVALSAYRGRNTVAGAGGAPSITGNRNRYSIGTTLKNLAGGEFRAEYLAGQDLTTNLSTGPKMATADSIGWYAMYLRPVAPTTKVGIRYDQWDPDIDNKFRVAGDGEVKTLGIVGLQKINETLTLTLAWERPRVTRYDSVTKLAATRDEDLLTFQGQYRF